MGASFFATPNPEVGAVFNYFIKDELKTLKDKRRELEKEKQKKGEDVAFPSYAELKKEGEQPEAFLLFTISDEQGNVVRKIKTGMKKGLNKLVWDFRYDTFSPISTVPFDNSIPWNEPEKGYMAAPGKYKVSLTKFEDGVFTELSTPLEFNCVPLNLNTLTAQDKASLDSFNKKVAEMTRLITGADAYRNELVNKINYLKKAVFETPKVPSDTYNKILAVGLKLEDLNQKFNGDNLRSKYEGGTPTALKERVELITSSLWSTTSAPTVTFIKSYETAASSFSEILNLLKAVGLEVETIEKILKENGAPYTPGRFPNLENK
jgi:hypothetical protein